MYRIVVALPVLLFAGLAAVNAYGLCPACEPIGAVPVLGQALPASFLNTKPGLTVVFLLSALVPFASLTALAWAARFHPGRRYSWVLAGLKYLALLGALALAFAVLYHRGVTAGLQARTLAGQASAGLPVVLASQAPHLLLEALGLSVVVAAPFYWAVRGLQVASLRRATFEGWVELRRLLWPAAGVLAVAAAVSAFLTPTVTTWLLAR